MTGALVGRLRCRSGKPKRKPQPECVAALNWCWTAKVRGFRGGDNPARWRGHLDKLLPKRAKVAPVVHHEALPYAEAGAFMKELRSREGMAPKALEFIILTAARVSEAVNAKWDEIDWRRPDRGKGSHGLLILGARRTVVRNPKDELKTGTYHALLKQLGLTERDIR